MAGPTSTPPSLAPLTALPEGSAIPIQRSTSRASRIGAALNSVKSTETHPPHHAHFDVPEHAPPSPHSSRAGEKDLDIADTQPPGTPRGDPEDVAEAVAPLVDIEHVPCEDDPREWSDKKKRLVLGMMTFSVLGPLIAPSIYNPVIDEVKAELNATDTQIGLSLSMYILLQGGMPVLWASTAEIFGRKPVYLASFALYTVAAVVASRSMNMPTLIAMRCIQAIGSSSPIALGAASLADMYEPHERGQKLGFFYGMPLLGPALGPLIGGALGNAFGWRSALYFLAAYAGVVDVLFLFFPDTWRRERSRVYQKAVQSAIKRALHHDEAKEKKRQRKLARGLASTAPTPPITPGPGTRRQSTSRDTPVESVGQVDAVAVDPERNEVEVKVKRRWFGFGRAKTEVETEHKKIRPSFRDVNPLPTMVIIWKSPTNIVMLFSSGLLFAAQYAIPYTASITLSKPPYNYNALYIGVIILAFGIGNLFGSVLGGRYSDIVLRKLKKANGGVSVPEMRLRSTIFGMPLIVGSCLAYAWTAGEKVHVAGVVVSLVLCGFAVMVIYSSTLAYFVDSNPGRSAAAVSNNSLVRGIFACVFSQAAIPAQNAIGDGGLYTIMSGLLALSSFGILTVIWKGEKWRSPEHKWPWQREDQSEKASRT